jgi:hypothetical protein
MPVPHSGIQPAGLKSGTRIPPASAAPLCAFVTGPRHSGRTRCIQRRLSAIRAAAPSMSPAVRAAVFIIDEYATLASAAGAPSGKPDAPSAADVFPGAGVRRLALPCICCPELVNLPAAIRALCDAAAGAGAPLSHLFIKVPDIAAQRLLAEFDGALSWPRTLALCLSPAWVRFRARPDRPMFLDTLLSLADEIIEPPETPAAAAGDAPGIVSISL